MMERRMAAVTRRERLSHKNLNPDLDSACQAVLEVRCSGSLSAPTDNFAKWQLNIEWQYTKTYSHECRLGTLIQTLTSQVLNTRHSEFQEGMLFRS